LAFAFGEMRLAYDDFWKMTPREYWNACNGHNERVERDFKTGWEQTRWLAHIVVNVNLPKQKQVTPEKLVKFPWEDGGTDIEAEIEYLKERRKWRTEH